MTKRKYPWNIKKLTREQKETRRRILEVSHKRHLSHLGSCLTAVDLIDTVYKIKKSEEKFVLSNGHAGMALYVVLEEYGFIKDSSIFKTLHVHPDRNTKIGIHVSTGSLGHGLPIALGMAMADRKMNVYCMISDGECAEGSIWESLRIASEYQVSNLKIILNVNGWGAYGAIPASPLKNRLKAFGCRVVEVNGHDTAAIAKALKRSAGSPLLLFAHTVIEQFPFLKGQDAHYYTMTEEDAVGAINTLI